MRQAQNPVTRHLLTPRRYPRKLSLVIPMYNESETVPLLQAAVQIFVNQVECQTEVLIVNDGSTDCTIELLVNWALNDRRIKVIQLSRNFGHQVAATAGLDYATGDAIVLIDADLQDPLAAVHGMIERYCEGYDV